ncbi:hypothetical protein [Pseudomonas putida]
MNQSIDLEAAKAAFFASGGQLVVLEGFTYRPLPERKHPAPSPKKRRGLPPVQSGTRQEKARAKAQMVAELAATMTCREASQALGVPQATLWDLAKRTASPSSLRRAVSTRQSPMMKSATPSWRSKSKHSGIKAFRVTGPH